MSATNMEMKFEEQQRQFDVLESYVADLTAIVTADASDRLVMRSEISALQSEVKELKAEIQLLRSGPTSAVLPTSAMLSSPRVSKLPDLQKYLPSTICAPKEAASAKAPAVTPRVGATLLRRSAELETVAKIVFDNIVGRTTFGVAGLKIKAIVAEGMSRCEEDISAYLLNFQNPELTSAEHEAENARRSNELQQKLESRCKTLNMKTKLGGQTSTPPSPAATISPTLPRAVTTTTATTSPAGHSASTPIVPITQITLARVMHLPPPATKARPALPDVHSATQKSKSKRQAGNSAEIPNDLQESVEKAVRKVWLDSLS